MLVPELLLQTLENLFEDDFVKFKWYLMMNVLGSSKPIPKSCLEKATRADTVSKMIENYGEASAVNITVELLVKMSNNEAAEKLRSTYAEGQTAATSTSSSSASAPPATPITISAQQGGVVIAPMVYGGTSGSWNINTK